MKFVDHDFDTESGVSKCMHKACNMPIRGDALIVNARDYQEGKAEIILCPPCAELFRRAYKVGADEIYDELPSDFTIPDKEGKPQLLAENEALKKRVTRLENTLNFLQTDMRLASVENEKKDRWTRAITGALLG